VTAQTEARPNPLIEAGKRAEAELAALRNLYDVALAESRAGRTTPEVWAAVVQVSEVRR
jgi:CRISPR/Cas system-associated protein Cas7 (RAMP superfamily)